MYFVRKLGMLYPNLNVGFFFMCQMIFLILLFAFWMIGRGEQRQNNNSSNNSCESNHCKMHIIRSLHLHVFMPKCIVISTLLVVIIFLKKIVFIKVFHN